MIRACRLVMPRNAAVTLGAAMMKQGGSRKCSDVIELKVNSLIVRGRFYPVMTSLSKTKSSAEGEQTVGKCMGGAAAGTILGGRAGGGQSAAIGDVVGGAGKTVLAAAVRPHLKIPAETRPLFRMMADWEFQ